MLHKTIKFENGMSVSEFSEKISEALKKSQLVHTIGVDKKMDLTEFWEQVSDNIGDCIPISENPLTGERTGNKWLEVRYDPSMPNAYRHSKNAQPLHTDGAYGSNAPNIIFFYCINQVSKGGETVFFDSYELIDMLKNEDRSLLEDLYNTPICFSKAKERRTRPIISFDEQGPVLNWNYYCVDPSESEFAKNLAERFHAFLQSKVVATNKTYPIKLLPEEAVFFHDERLLHGRNAFEASVKDERFFWKAGINLK